MRFLLRSLALRVVRIQVVAVVRRAGRRRRSCVDDEGRELRAASLSASALLFNFSDLINTRECTLRGRMMSHLKDKLSLKCLVRFPGMSITGETREGESLREPRKAYGT